ncbi:MAG: YpoC family protein [Bacillaceae bacterium]
MQTIEEGFTRWNELKETLTGLFNKRNRKEAQGWMEEAFALYKQIREEVTLNYGEVQLLNERERIHFIKGNINHYHAFIQLKELYVELEKVYYKSKAMKKSDG